jgi:4-aminobutyrate aminotransferase
MDALPFAPRRYACEPAVELAEKLAAITPGRLSKVLFTTGGSDAVEVAVKIARAATGRSKTLSFWDAFHGAGIGAAALSGEMLFRSGPARRSLQARCTSRPSAATAALTGTPRRRRARRLARG